MDSRKKKNVRDGNPVVDGGLGEIQPLCVFCNQHAWLEEPTPKVQRLATINNPHPNSLTFFLYTERYKDTWLELSDKQHPMRSTFKSGGKKLHSHCFFGSTSPLPNQSRLRGTFIEEHPGFLLPPNFLAWWTATFDVEDSIDACQTEVFLSVCGSTTSLRYPTVWLAVKQSTSILITVLPNKITW